MTIVDDKIAVRELMQRYVDAWTGKDVEAFKALFHPKFMLIGVSKKGVHFTGADIMYPIVTDPETSWDKYTADISHIDVAGSVATAVVEEYGFNDIELLATSYFHLVKENDQWLITCKSYHFHK